ncbi:Isopentenyldiphosphate isomerase [Eubacterium pyruvativorans]|uniref:Isopentenyldiphosphate isomerase n=1 Tax=Eubacterium pyruvativorans TaxID=155865 RepID=A0A1I7FEI3_9FIRM|nr:NUDIX hydrolase [Eubacterium pyruvativorans]MCI5747432.1 NUDIX hydrolase [Eubacterium pyruvativorans]MDD6708383.1 NUDIX hydrolase [Eubacterium pyruvativorans]MDD7685321.1 NUDIX hydrolase [Eubacterium pyruvativorans]MDY4050014.1 NUDIX hydrolase [Eubacterium pyruvativorans]SFN84888.1 Isopentenyldiphosphate isomerase [Eubacterium pyruvativorans]
MELWDIYDENKQPTGRTMVRDDWNMKDDEFHLTVQAAIMRPDGRFLITRRKLTKSWGAGWWEVSGGGVLAGETSREAVIREVREETGLDVTSAKSDLAFTYRRDNHEEKNNYFVDVYRFELDFDESDVTVQEEEVEEFRLATPEEIRALGEQGIFNHYSSIRRVFGL